MRTYPLNISPECILLNALTMFNLGYMGIVWDMIDKNWIICSILGD